MGLDRSYIDYIRITENGMEATSYGSGFRV